MTAVFSGGLVYEYTMEENGYGIVQVDSDTSVTELTDYQTLKTQIAANPPPSGDGGYNSTHAASACPAYSSNWNITDNTLPAIPAAAQKYMSSGAGDGVGLTGSGSQSGGGTSTGTASAGSGSVTSTASRSSSTASSTAGSSSSASSASGAAASSSAASAAGRTVAGPLDQAYMVMGTLFIGFSALGALLL